MRGPRGSPPRACGSHQEQSQGTGLISHCYSEESEPDGKAVLLATYVRTYVRTYVCTSPCIRFCLSLPPLPCPPPRTKRCAKRWILKFAWNLRKSRVDSRRAPVQGRSQSPSRGAFCGQPGPARTPVSLARKDEVCARWGDRPRKSKPKPC